MYESTSQPNASFEIITSQFELKAKYSDKKLWICLNDFVSEYHYQKQFTYNDIENDIHKKIDLLDIYYSLSKPVQYFKQNQSIQKDYKIGQIFLYINKKCFKIQNDGVIIVYDYFDKKSNKDETYITFTSNLHLRKIRKLDQKQMYDKKIEAIKRLKNIQIQRKNHYIKQMLKIPFPLLIGLMQSTTNLFKYNGNMVQFVGIPGQKHFPAHFMFNQFLPKNCESKFKIRVVCCPKGELSIGVANYQTKKFIRYSIQNTQSAYLKNNVTSLGGGQICSQYKNIQVPLGFKEGDIIEVTVMPNLGKMFWHVDNIQCGAIKDSILLNNKNAVLVPSVQFMHYHDIVEFVN